jgi:hypothetical protein
MQNLIDAGFRRLATPFIVRMLRQSAAQKANKKQQEEKAKTSPLNAVASKRYRNTQKLAEWKKSAKSQQFPTGGRRYRADKKRIKQEFKKTKKIQKQLYKTDGAYRATHYPPRNRSVERLDMTGWTLRYEAKHGSSILTRGQSQRVLKKWYQPLVEGFDVRNIVKPLNPFGRKKRKKMKVDAARAMLDLRGEV